MKEYGYWIVIGVVILIVIFFVFRSPSLKETEDTANNLNINSTTNNNSLASKVTPDSNKIPLLDYSCQSIFPKSLVIQNIIWVGAWDYTSNNFTNGLALKLNCKRETSEGGNINLYHCISGFIVSQYALSDGTIINKNYFVSYSFTLDKRNCSEDRCIPITLSCNSKEYENNMVVGDKLNDAFYFSDIILSIDALNCNGCLGNDGKCYSVGSTYMGKICVK